MIGLKENLDLLSMESWIDIMRAFRVLKRSISIIGIRNLEVRMDILKMKEFVERNGNYFEKFNENYFEEYIVWLEGGNLDG